jgi:hypothetical protein
MKAEDKALNELKSEIETELRAIVAANMKFVGWSVPESDETYTREHIIDIMREAVEKIAAEKE